MPGQGALHGRPGSMPTRGVRDGPMRRARGSRARRRERRTPRRSPAASRSRHSPDPPVRKNRFTSFQLSWDAEGRAPPRAPACDRALASAASAAARDAEHGIPSTRASRASSPDEIGAIVGVVKQRDARVTAALPAGIEMVQDRRQGRRTTGPASWTKTRKRSTGSWGAGAGREASPSSSGGRTRARSSAKCSKSMLAAWCSYEIATSRGSRPITR